MQITGLGARRVHSVFSSIRVHVGKVEFSWPCSQSDSLCESELHFLEDSEVSNVITISGTQQSF